MTSSPRSARGERSVLAAVAVPTEHGGWGLTLEPVLLGLVVAGSWPGVALGAAALVAFVARTPVKVALVDHARHRHLDRTTVAARVGACEVGLLAALLTIAAATASGPFWVPLVIVVPLVLVELWFDMRSRSRRLLPELAGAIGIAGIVAAIVLADGGAFALAFALWGILAARVVASIPFVRVQLRRFKGQANRRSSSDVAQAAAVIVALAACALDSDVAAGLVAVCLVAGFQLGAVRRRPPPAARVGAQEVVVGLTVVLVTALGVLAP